MTMKAHTISTSFIDRAELVGADPEVIAWLRAEPRTAPELIQKYFIWADYIVVMMGTWKAHATYREAVSQAHLDLKRSTEAAILVALNEALRENSPELNGGDICSD